MTNSTTAEKSNDVESKRSSVDGSVTPTSFAPSEVASPPDLELQRTKSSAAPYSIFTQSQKRAIILMATCAAFFSPLSANIYFPALNDIASALHVSVQDINLTLTTYLIFQGISPTIVGDFADSVGRRPAYLTCFIIYIGACVGIALVPNFVGLLILRMVQSAGSSGTITLASAVAADVATSSERGTYMGWALSGAMIGPAVGPIIGGLLSQYLGWRAIFWFLVIIGGVVLAMLLIFMPETGRNIVGNGSKPPQPWNYSVLTLISRKRQAKNEDAEDVARQQNATVEKRKIKIPNPLTTLKVLGEKDAALVLFINSLNFAAYYQLTASLPFLLDDIYHFDVLTIGLCFIPFGFGCFLAPSITGRLLDWNFRRVAANAGIVIEKSKTNSMKDFPLEKARIPVAAPMAFIAIAAEIAYGWCLEYEVSLAAPLVMTFLMGLTFTGLYSVFSVMIVDYYPQSPATAAAAVNLCRCLLGAGATAVIIYMIQAMGRGWCFTFIALVLLAVTPSMFILSRWGPKWRDARRAKLERLAQVTTGETREKIIAEEKREEEEEERIIEEDARSGVMPAMLRRIYSQ